MKNNPFQEKNIIILHTSHSHVNDDSMIIQDDVLCSIVWALGSGM